MRIWKRITRAIKAYWCLEFKKCTPVLIYAPGRVGSVSIIESFDRAKIFAIKLENLENKVWRSTNFVREKIIYKNKNAQIITVVREPVSFLVAYYFSIVPKFPELKLAAEKGDVEFLGQEFVRLCLHDWPFEHYLKWYERELQNMLGIDLLAEEFDKNIKWQFINNSRYPTLILRSDLNDRVKEETIESCFGHKISIRRSNEASDKKFAAIYKTFRKNFKLPAEEFERIYQTKMARHFFSDEERSSAKRLWSQE